MSNCYWDLIKSLDWKRKGDIAVVKINTPTGVKRGRT
jgi:hypothetical protein